MPNIFLDLPLPLLNGTGVAVDTSAMGRQKTIVGVGAFPGATVFVEVSNDGGVVFQPLVVFQYLAQEVVIEVAAQFMRLRVQGRKSGVPFACDVDVGSSDTGGLFTTIPLPVFNGPGPAVNVSLYGELTTFIAGGAFLGTTITIETSEDGTSYAPTVVFSGTGNLQTTIVTKEFVRANVSGRKSGVPFAASVSLGAIHDYGTANGIDIYDEGAAIPGNPHTGLNFVGDGVVATDQGGGVARIKIDGVQPKLYTVYVGKNGVDATADGSIGKPFLTVQAAMEFAWTTYVLPVEPQPVPPFRRPCVMVNAGTYDDGALVLPPQICVMGEGFNHTRIKGDWSIDARWTNYPPPGAIVPSDMRSSWINVGLFGAIDIDFAPVASNEGKLYAFGVRFAGNVTINEKTINPVSNQIDFIACEFLADITLGGIPTHFQQCSTLGGTLTLNQLVGTGVDNLFETNGGSFGNIVINSTSPAAPAYNCAFGHLAQPGATLTLNGTFSTVNAVLGAVPLQSLVVLAGGANLNQIVRINQLDWSGVTADRPSGPYVGQQYFDTTITRPVWWDGASWITWSVLVQDEGAAIAGNPFTTLNFVGGGVTASDLGGGVAKIEVPVVAGPPGPVGPVGPTGAAGAGAVLFWGSSTFPASSTRFMPPGRMDSSPPTTSVYRMRMPRAGTLRNLFARHNSAAGVAAGPITYTIFVNGVATAIVIAAMSATVVGVASDTVHSVVVAQGDDVALRETNAGSAAVVDSMVTLELA